ncbi:IucC family-domain-containing protein [Gigaspora margarita]|uniref:IucC family-domain-containing protein n=1 Tax=Gigaspora margarita TaxID=4874 RepID=A0A8H3XEW2_GIGMA|nr:IucC family-domain-containing protein [Gigaspora margarita]
MILSPNQRANFAATSRLVACAINEHIVKAFYQLNYDHSKLINYSMNHGAIFILPKNDNISSVDHRIIIVIPMLCEPILSNYNENNNSTLIKVDFINPCDMTAPIYKINCDLFQLTDVNDLESFVTNSVNQGEEICTIELMNILGIWLNLDNNIVSSVNEELDNNIKNQEYTFKNPQAIPSLHSSSMEWEQSLIEGHPFHPMHKLRYCFPPLPQILPGTYDFRYPTIRFVEVPRDKTYLRGPFEEKLNRLINVMSKKPICSPNNVIYPVHELQLPNISAKFPYVKILPPEYSIKSSSQASLRSLVVPSIPELVFKVSIGIKTTSALRTISPWSTHGGTEFTKIIDKLYVDKNILKIAPEIASATVNEQDFAIAKHLSCIIREDYNDQTSGGEKVIICAALIEKDENGISFVERVFRLDTEEKRIKFFERYSQLLFAAFLPSALYNGVSLEAHLQNVLARFDPHSEQLVGFVFRDFGALRFHQDTLYSSTGIRVNLLKDNVAEAYDLDEVYTTLYNKLIFCHVYCLIYALNLHHSGVGWKIVRKHLSELIPRDHLLWNLWLENKVFKLKSFLRMRIEGLYRTYLYEECPNLILYKCENGF